MGNCGTPPNIELGYWKKCDNGVTYRCNEGAEMSGNSEIQCQNGRFTPNLPTCTCEYIAIK